MLKAGCMAFEIRLEANQSRVFMHCLVLLLGSHLRCGTGLCIFCKEAEQKKKTNKQNKKKKEKKAM